MWPDVDAVIARVRASLDDPRTPEQRERQQIDNAEYWNIRSKVDKNMRVDRACAKAGIPRPEPQMFEIEFHMRRHGPTIRGRRTKAA